MILIRQSLYEAKTMSLSKKEPITFDDAGTSGIPLDMALSFTVPEGWKTEYMRCLSGTKKTIRINWPGYPPWNMAINVSDDTCNRNPVTKAKLTHNVAKAVKKFLDEHHNKRQCKPNEWAIGKNIKLSDISLGMLSHVSEGSLQPTLYITESALLRSPHE
ncbi:hypothetical protein BDY19DRAFT_295269 [Irpex rosettiformis]|uniref:Uncharacterized protein n=1 Tax=Irpex rosettiformis TaxID=378272 RepID=A0ACB8UIB8_9APHY|nr:hypothetical protein BDY19DRAFT_295269 [Irpex rosettiformis]